MYFESVSITILKKSPVVSEIVVSNEDYFIAKSHKKSSNECNEEYSW